MSEIALYGQSGPSAFQADDEGSIPFTRSNYFRYLAKKRRSQKWAWERAGNDPTAGASRRVTARPLGFSSIGAGDQDPAGRGRPAASRRPRGRRRRGRSRDSLAARPRRNRATPRRRARITPLPSRSRRTPTRCGRRSRRPAPSCKAAARAELASRAGLTLTASAL